jgi:hypothetical protein
MLTLLFLSADSVFAAWILRFFGVSRRDLNYASWSIGLADGIALVLGYALRNFIMGRTLPHPGLLLIALSILFSILVARTVPKRPRLATTAVAVLFSLDNLMAGTRLGSMGMVALTALFCVMGATLFCRAAFLSSDVLTVRIRPRVLFGLGTAMVTAHLLFF